MVQGKFQLSLPKWLIIVLMMPIMMAITLVAIQLPIYLAVACIGLVVCYLFFRYFEHTVIGLLILRSALDLFSAQQLPSLFAVGVDALVVVHIGYLFMTHQTVQTDRFWWLFISWLSLQSLWVILLPLGGLGADPSVLGDSIREWVRLFSGGLVYLLVMQLKDRITPERLINLLFFCVVVPTAIAILQTLPIGLPSLLTASNASKALEGGSRVQGSLGHPNSFANFTLLFTALSLWKGEHAKQPVRWYGLAGLLVFLLLASQSLTGLVMLSVFIIVYFLPKLRGKDLFWALGIIAVTGILLATTNISGRLGELSSTPLLNPDLDWSRAIALQLVDSGDYGNSFNWRLAQWSSLLQLWHLHPWFGYGLASTEHISPFENAAHNDYVRSLVEGGIVGLMAFILFLIAQLVRLIQIIRSSLPSSPRQRLGMTLLAFQIAMWIGMLTGNVTVSTTLLFYWWTLLAVLGWPWPTFSSSNQSLIAFQPPSYV
jgi:O-antigen ligase